MRIVKYIFITIFFFLLQCASTNKSAYKINNSISYIAVKDIESDDKIDQSRTYQIFFTLKKNEDCINIGLSSQIFDESINKNINLKTYFIIEKSLDLSGFSDSYKKLMYSEIGRNYDNNWTARSEIQLCSADDPIMQLKKDDKFRLRFTAFRDKEFKFNLIIRSKKGVDIANIESSEEKL